MRLVELGPALGQADQVDRAVDRAHPEVGRIDIAVAEVLGLDRFLDRHIVDEGPDATLLGDLDVVDHLLDALGHVPDLAGLGLGLRGLDGADQQHAAPVDDSADVLPQPQAAVGQQLVELELDLVVVDRLVGRALLRGGIGGLGAQRDQRGCAGRQCEDRDQAEGAEDARCGAISRSWSRRSRSPAP